MIGCGNSDPTKPEFSIPIYEECIEPLNRFLNLINEDKLNAELRLFDFKSDAHPYIVGYVNLKNNGDLEINVNTVKGICHPQARVAYDKGEGAVRGYISDVENFSMQGEKIYTDITRTNLLLYYNDKKTSWWNDFK